MTPVDTVRELWARIGARDWTGLGALLADDVELVLPATGERIVGRAHVVAVNAEYPQGWSVLVRRVFADQAHGAGADEAATVVSEVDVPLDGVGLFTAVSFWTVLDGVVTAGREYWTTVGGEQPPAWRRRYTTPLPV